MSLQDLLRPVGGAPVVSATELAAMTPFDGQEVYLQAEESPNTLWHLRFNEGSSSTYQWEFLGGPAMRTFFESSTAIDNTPHDAWRSPDGGLPQLFVPRPGVYYVRFGAVVGAPADGVTTIIGVGLDGSDPVVGNEALQYNTRVASVASEHQVELSGTLRVRMMYWRGDSAGNDMDVSRRFISILPVRVS